MYNYSVGQHTLDLKEICRGALMGALQHQIFKILESQILLRCLLVLRPEHYIELTMEKAWHAEFNMNH